MAKKKTTTPAARSSQQKLSQVRKDAAETKKFLLVLALSTLALVVLLYFIFT
jgi:hypothetical protein